MNIFTRQSISIIFQIICYAQQNRTFMMTLDIVTHDFRTSEVDKNGIYD